MPPALRIPVTFGRGLDRATAGIAVDPGSMQDIRNMEVRDAAVAMRWGMYGTGFPRLPAGSDIVHIQPLYYSRDILFVVFTRATRKLALYRLNPLSNTAYIEFVANWGTLDENALMPPVVTACESYGLLFFAHAEYTYNYRLDTIYYTPNADDALVGTITTLTADLNNDGIPFNLRYRLVKEHNSQVWGTGVGNELSLLTKDRPDCLRASRPGDPLTWYPEFYWNIGIQNQAIEALCQLPGAQPSLIIAKQHQTYQMLGSDAQTYQPVVLDPNYGALNARCAVSAQGAVWLRGLTGVRYTIGGATVDVSKYLDNTVPADLYPSEPKWQFEFLSFDPLSRTLELFKPGEWADASTSETPSFMCSLRDQPNAELRWTYNLRERRVFCAAVVLMASKGPGAAPAPAVSTAYWNWNDQSLANIVYQLAFTLLADLNPTEQRNFLLADKTGNGYDMVVGDLTMWAGASPAWLMLGAGASVDLPPTGPIMEPTTPPGELDWMIDEAPWLLVVRTPAVLPSGSPGTRRLLWVCRGDGGLQAVVYLDEADWKVRARFWLADASEFELVSTTVLGPDEEHTIALQWTPLPTTFISALFIDGVLEVQSVPPASADVSLDTARHHYLGDPGLGAGYGSLTGFLVGRRVYLIGDSTFVEVPGIVVAVHNYLRQFYTDLPVAV